MTPREIIKKKIQGILDEIQQIEKRKTVLIEVYGALCDIDAEIAAVENGHQVSDTPMQSPITHSEDSLEAAKGRQKRD